MIAIPFRAVKKLEQGLYLSPAQNPVQFVCGDGHQLVASDRLLGKDYIAIKGGSFREQECGFVFVSYLGMQNVERDGFPARVPKWQVVPEKKVASMFPPDLLKPIDTKKVICN